MKLFSYATHLCYYEGMKLSDDQNKLAETYYKLGGAEGRKFFLEQLDAGVPINEICATAIISMPIEKQVKLAEFFSEGSSEYKKWLLNLWGAGIPTYMGCSGIDKTHPKRSLPKRLKICKDFMQGNNSPKTKALWKQMSIKQKADYVRRVVRNGNKVSLHSLIFLTPENRKQFASILEQISQEDLGYLKCRMNLDPPPNEGKDQGMDINSRIIGFSRPYGKAFTEEQSNTCFGRLNAAFERAKKQGLSSETPLREIKNKLDAMQANKTEDKLR